MLNGRHPTPRVAKDPVLGVCVTGGWSTAAQQEYSTRSTPLQDGLGSRVVGYCRGRFSDQELSLVSCGV